MSWYSDNAKFNEHDDPYCVWKYKANNGKCGNSKAECDSMKDAGINHGDIAFLRKSYDFLQGGIYAVVFGDDENAVLKKVYRQGDGLLLMPCNQKYDPISVKDARIVGECIGIYSPRNN